MDTNYNFKKFYIDLGCYIDMICTHLIFYNVVKIPKFVNCLTYGLVNVIEPRNSVVTKYAFMYVQRIVKYIFSKGFL